MKLPFDGPLTQLQQIMFRAQQSKYLDHCWVITSTLAQDDPIAELFPDHVYRGSELDVLGRYCQAAEMLGLSTVIRLTGDNPCIDPTLMDQAVEHHLNQGNDYTYTHGLPLGTNLEIISFAALKAAHQEADTDFFKEHVTAFLRQHPKRFKNDLLQIKGFDEAFQSLRLTVDYPSDYALVNMVFQRFGNQFTLRQLEKWFLETPWLKDVNPNPQKNPC